VIVYGIVEQFGIDRMMISTILTGIILITFGFSSFLTKLNMKMLSLISFKVMMNQFQRTFFLFDRKIHIFESALIHCRTHTAGNNKYRSFGG
jgi:hypothetical protein